MFWGLERYKHQTKNPVKQYKTTQQYNRQKTHNTYYRLNFEKIKKGCDELWFGNTKLDTNVTPRNMVIDESEPFHFVQLLYIIKEKSWDDNTWLVFRENELINWVHNHRNIYMENNIMFGEEFYSQFNAMIKYFINNYCDKYMRT